MSLPTGPTADEDGALVDSLSPRERQLLVMATDGHTDQAIANELGISLATVSTYWGRIRIKFGPLGRTEIVARYLRAQMNRATKELQASEQRYRLLFSLAPEAIVTIDENHRIVDVNASAERMFDYERDEMVGQPLGMLIPSRFHDDHRGYVEGFGKGTIAAARPMAARSNVWGLHKDGTEFPCEASIVRQEIEGRAQYTAIVRDVTDRVRSTETAPSSVRDFPGTVLRLDAEGKLIDRSEFAKHTQIDAEDQPVFDKARTAAREHRTSEAAVRVEGRWHHASIRAVSDGWTVILTDVHDQAVAADELRRIRAVLGS